MNKKEFNDLLQQVRKEKQEYLNKQFSKNFYYVLRRFFGASWWWYIRELTKIEENLIKNEKRI